MGETTQKERDELHDDPHPQPEDVRRVIDDADRLADIERQLDRAHDALHELLANHINIMDPAATIAKRGLWGETQPEQEDESDD